MRALVCIVVAIAAHCAAAEGIRIGVLLPPAALEATNIQRGVEVALAVANGRGAKVEALFSHSHGQWGTAGDEAARLVLDEKVTALVAPRDRAITHLALQVSGRTATRVATLCSDSSVTGTGVPWCARVGPGTNEMKAPATIHVVPSEFTRMFSDRFGIAPNETAIAAADAVLLLSDTCSETSWPSCGHEHRGVSGPLIFDAQGNRLFESRATTR